jgi:uncharacterized repeat protein (TIGR03843 family)
VPATQRISPVAGLSEGPLSPLAEILPVEQALRILIHGEMELEGRLVDASNTTLRAFITLDGVSVRCVYKPERGERPLWDFPDGTLAGREVAAYAVSAAAGWNVVPPTVLRPGGPLGPGACQLWVEESGEPLVGFVPAEELPEAWLRIAAAEDEDGQAYLLAHADDVTLARMALFDVIVNNADRKGGHVLHTMDGRLYGVDHGLCFHTEDKLRTVLWGWAGRPLPDGERDILLALRADLAGPLGKRLREHILPAELRATRDRVDTLLAEGVFPQPSPQRRVIPWPPV